MSTIVRAAEGQPGEPPVHLLQGLRPDQARQHQEAGHVAHTYNQDKLSRALMRKYGKALTVEKHTNSHKYKKPYVLFPRTVNYEVVSPPVGKGKPFTSKYTGVTWHKRALGWSANISKNSSVTGKACYIGIYDTEKDAALAFDRSDQKIISYPQKKLNHIKFPHDF